MAREPLGPVRPDDEAPSFSFSFFLSLGVDLFASLLFYFVLPMQTLHSYPRLILFLESYFSAWDTTSVIHSLVPTLLYPTRTFFTNTLYTTPPPS